jgi:hypothetical protein
MTCAETATATAVMQTMRTMKMVKRKSDGDYQSHPNHQLMSDQSNKPQDIRYQTQSETS